MPLRHAGRTLLPPHQALSDPTCLHAGGLPPGAGLGAARPGVLPSITTRSTVLGGGRLSSVDSTENTRWTRSLASSSRALRTSSRQEREFDATEDRPCTLRAFVHVQMPA